MKRCLTSILHNATINMNTNRRAKSTASAEPNVPGQMLVCVCQHRDPHLLNVFSGIDTFKGTYFHSRDYKTPEEWRNKKAVVIGIGNSGGDIAVELSRVTKQV